MAERCDLLGNGDYEEASTTSKAVSLGGYPSCGDLGALCVGRKEGNAETILDQLPTCVAKLCACNCSCRVYSRLGELEKTVQWSRQHRGEKWRVGVSRERNYQRCTRRFFNSLCQDQESRFVAENETTFTRSGSVNEKVQLTRMAFAKR